MRLRACIALVTGIITEVMISSAECELLVAVKPTGKGDYEEMEGLYDRGHCSNRLSVISSDNNIIRLVRIFAPSQGRGGRSEENLPIIYRG